MTLPTLQLADLPRYERYRAAGVFAKARRSIGNVQLLDGAGNVVTIGTDFADALSRLDRFPPTCTKRSAE